MKIPFKKTPIEFDQHVLFPSHVFDLLPEDHDCYIFSQILDQIDTTEIEQKYKVIGQNAYHPRLLIKILIYAYSHDVFSARRIERHCHQDLAFMYIAEMNCPNFRVLSDFRKENGGFFKECFKKTVSYALELQLISLGHISIDGSKFKANTSKHKAMSYGKLKKKEQELSDQIEELIKKATCQDEKADEDLGDQTGFETPDDLKTKKQRLKKVKTAKAALEAREKERNPGKEIDDKKQISFADPEANIMGKKSFEYAYNAQVSAEEKNQFIVGQHISQKANDLQEVQAALEEVEHTTGELPEKASLDNGYYSGPNLEALETKGIDAYVAVGREGKKLETLEKSERKLVKMDFTYDEKEDCFICPKGEKLRLRTKKENKNTRVNYKAKKEVCQNCPLFKRCSGSIKGDPRVVTSDGYESQRQQMNKKMETAKAKDIYKKRKSIVEPVFGQIKNTGFRGFLLRGLAGVQTEFSLMCLTYNLKKLIKCAAQGEVCLESEKIWK